MIRLIQDNDLSVNLCGRGIPETLMLETISRLPTSIAVLARDYLSPAYDGPFGTLLAYPSRIYTASDISNLFIEELENGNEEYLKSYVENFQATHGKRLEIATLSHQRFFINIETKSSEEAKKAIREAIVKRADESNINLEGYESDPIGRFPSRILWFLDNPSTSLEPFCTPKLILRDILFGAPYTGDTKGSILVFHSLKAKTSSTFFWFRDFADQLRSEIEKGDWETPASLKSNDEIALYIYKWMKGDENTTSLHHREGRIIQAANAGHHRAVRMFISQESLYQQNKVDLVSILARHGIEYVKAILGDDISDEMRHHLSHLPAQRDVPDSIIDYIFGEAYLDDSKNCTILALIDGGRESAFYKRMANGDSTDLSVLLEQMIFNMGCRNGGTILSYLLEVLDGTLCKGCRQRYISRYSIVKDIRICDRCNAAIQPLTNKEWESIASGSFHFQKFPGSRIVEVAKYFIKHKAGKRVICAVIVRGILLRSESIISQYIDYLLDAPDQKGREEQLLFHLNDYRLHHPDIHWFLSRAKMKRFVDDLDVDKIVKEALSGSYPRISRLFISYFLKVPFTRIRTEKILKASSRSLLELAMEWKCSEIFALCEPRDCIKNMEMIIGLAFRIYESGKSIGCEDYVPLADHLSSLRGLSWDDLPEEKKDDVQLPLSFSVLKGRIRQRVLERAFGSNPWREFFDSLSDPKTDQGKRTKKYYQDRVKEHDRYEISRDRSVIEK